MAKILAIDDESSIVEAVKLILGAMGHVVVGCSDPVEGERQALEGEFDLIVTDLRMPRLDGAALIESVRRDRPQARILAVTAYPQDELAERALAAGAVALLSKPFEVARILDFLPA